MTVGGNTRSRKARRKPNGNRPGAGKSTKPKKTVPQKSKRKGRTQQPQLRALLEDFGECGVLYAKAVQDPFHFVNSNTKLPCVPSGPKVKTKRVATWRRGKFNTNSSGNGFLLFSPWKIASDYGPGPTNEDPIWYSTNAFASTVFLSPTQPGSGVSSDKFTNSTIRFDQDPVMRIVAAGLRIQCNGPLLYTSGQMTYCQLPNITDSWNGRSIGDLQNFTDSIIQGVDHKMRTYTWRFGSNRPQTVVSEQQEFMDLSRMAAFDGHNMAVSVSGAPGSGAGLEFRYEACVIFEYVNLNDGIARTPPPDGIYTESSTKAHEFVSQYAAERRGDVTGTTIASTIDSISKVHAKATEAAQAVHTISNLMQHLKM